MRHDKIISALGGYAALAEKLGYHPTTVFKWSQRGIPTLRYEEIIDLAKKNKELKGLTWEALARGASRR